MSLLGVLGVIFIVLKLVGVITWSWLWVLCPFWVPIAIYIIFIIIVNIIVLLDHWGNK
jgi:hypothetical protein